MSRRLPNRVEELERELALLEPVYDRAKMRVSGEDEEWAFWRDQTVTKMAVLIKQFNIEDAPSKAVAIIAQMLPWAAELTQSQKIVDDYEHKKKTLSHLRAETSRRTEAETKSRIAYDESVRKMNEKPTWMNQH